MKSLSVLALVNESLVPPESMEGYSEEEIDEWKTEYDVITTMREMGHKVDVVGVNDDLTPMRNSIIGSKPDVAFNLLEEFNSVVTYDHAIVSYLELMKQAYTGCNPRGLMLSKDKALSKKIMTYHRISSPKFVVFPRGRKIDRPKKLRFPIFVKSVIDDASLGISQSSIVRDDDELRNQVAYIHEHTQADALAEEFIEGREFYVGVMGNDRLQTLPIWELRFAKDDGSTPLIATRKVKWDRRYQKKLGVETAIAKDLEASVTDEINRLCKRLYRALDLSGYARMDLRMNDRGEVYVLEANANPNLAFGEDFAESAEAIGISYEELLQKILSLGIRYHAAWKSI